jgi:CTP synthase
MFCNVPENAVIEERDVDDTIYEIPLVLRDQKLDEILLTHFKLDSRDKDLVEWSKMVDAIKFPQHTTEIALVGKYIELDDAYKSIFEALTHAGAANDARVNVRRVSTGAVERDGCVNHLSGVHGILVPGGFGERGLEGKIAAVRYAREQRIPFLGICLGMQCATIEFARTVLGLTGATSTEFDKKTPHPVISLLDEQLEVENLGGTMRLGAYPCRIEPGSCAHAAYDVSLVRERHRHRYEFNNRYRDLFESRGFRLSGLSPDGKLVEIIEIEDHPWFVASQFHPEFRSKPTAAHPLFREFVSAALTYAQSSAAKAPLQTTELSG